MTREAFEAFISAPPFEMPTERFDDRCAWPGGYTELEVDLAWQAWQAAKATCPAWHDAPTVPGLWVSDFSWMAQKLGRETVEFYAKNRSIPSRRWYGPISEDKP